jgi:hypothetical protein
LYRTAQRREDPSFFCFSVSGLKGRFLLPKVMDFD